MDFEKSFLDWIHMHYPKQDVRIENIYRMNETYRGIMVVKKQEGAASPILPLEKYQKMHEEGMDFGKIFWQFSTDYFYAVQNIPKQISQAYSIALNRENILSKVHFRMVDPVRNAGYIEGVPYITWQDLAAIPVMELEVPDGKASLRIIDDVLEKTGIRKEELFAAAKANAVPSMRPMLDVMLEMVKTISGEEDVREFNGIFNSADFPWYVLRSGAVDGASVVLDEKTLQRAGEAIGKDYYLIPISVDEFLAAPVGGEVKELLERVAEVNDELLEPDKILSYSIYHYDRQKKLVTTISSPEQNRGLYGR